MPYKYLENVATADIAFEARGEDLEDLFIQAADAMMNVMVEELDAILPLEKRRIQLEDEALDLLLFDFLQELIYYKDSERLMLRVRKAQIQEKGKRYTLDTVALGEKLDPVRHHPRVDVKAVTLHNFLLERTPHGWETHVILDI